MQFIPFPSQKNNLPRKITSLHFSPDGKTLVGVDRFDTWVVSLSWWNLEKQSEIHFGPDDLDFAIGVEEDAGFAVDPVVSSAFRFLAYVYIERGPEYSLRLFDRTANKRSKKRECKLAAIGRENYSNIGEYLALRFSPDGQFLVAAVVANENQSGIYRWKIEKILRGHGPKSEDHLIAEPDFFLMPEVDINYHSGIGRSLVFSSDGKLLSAGLWGNRVLTWEFPSGKELPPIKLKRGQQANATRLAYHPKSSHLAVSDQTIAFFDPSRGTREVSLSAKAPKTSGPDQIWNPNVFDIEFHPSGKLLASAGGDSLVRFWDGETGEEKETFDWEIGNVRAVAFSPDGCLCAAAGKKGIAIWDVAL